MEPLPTQGQTLRHYTASRPRPRRTHTQPPSFRPQEPVSEVDYDTNETMGRVDEGVEEFFTKKILPDYALKGRWAQATPPESSPTPSTSTPCFSPFDITPSSITTNITSPSVASPDTSLLSTDVPLIYLPPPTPYVDSTSTTNALPTKNIKKRFGDFFAFKKTRAGRAAKGGDGEGDGGEGVKVKRTSIVDLIRPLREAKDRERERERDKEREKEGEERSEEDANVSNDATVTEGTNATGLHHVMRKPVQTLPSTMTPSRAAPSSATISSSPDVTSALFVNLGKEAVVISGQAPNPMVMSPPVEQKGQVEKSLFGERRLRVTTRALREAKSQSLILLTGPEAEDKDNTSKKHESESSSGFERRLQVMLHRIGVNKSLTPEAKRSQNKDEELRKANSEGAILDKPAPPPTHVKPRTMSSSSVDSRTPMRALDRLGPDPLFCAKSNVPESPVGVGLAKPVIAVKPSLPTPAVRAAKGPHPPPTASSSCFEKEKLKRESNPDLPEEKTEQVDQNGGFQNADSRGEKMFHSALPSGAVVSTKDSSERAPSATEDFLPEGQQMKPPPQRRAVSVHEESLAMTQELKAVLQRSPIRFRGNRRNLPSCIEDLPCNNKEKQRSYVGDPNKQLDEKKIISDNLRLELKAENKGIVCKGKVAETKRLLPDLGAQFSAAQRPIPPSLIPHALQCVQDRPLNQHQALEKSCFIPKSNKKSPSTATALSQSPEKSSTLTLSPVGPLHHEQSCSAAGASNEVKNWTRNKAKVECRQKTEQRTEPPIHTDTVQSRTVGGSLTSGEFSGAEDDQ